MQPVAIVSGARTAIGTFGGSLKSVRGPHLAAAVIRAAIDRVGHGFTADQLGDVKMGSCMEDYDGLNTARVGALLAGVPDTVPAVTINRVCISGMEAVAQAVTQIQAGFIDAAVAGGVESMSNAPYILPHARWGQRLQDSENVDSLIRGLYSGSHFVPYPKDGPVSWLQGKPYIMGITAELLAQKHGITREEQDEVALKSHNNAERASSDGTFAEEIVPVEIPQKRGRPPVVVDKDEHFRVGATLEDLAKMPPAFIPKKGTVTAGNASGINDGATAMVIMSVEKAEKLGLEPIALITGMGLGGCAPEYMGESPVPAVHNLLERTNRSSIDHFERIEVNEAFAAQYIAVERGLNLPREITNVNGSGIGLGHPVGSTGARIVFSLANELRRSGLQTGLATLCGGGGVSMALELQRP